MIAALTSTTVLQLLTANVVNDVSESATNADTIALEDAVDVTASVAAVAFLVVEYLFYDNFRKMEKLTQQRKRTSQPSCNVHTGTS